jgi:hypothetical protein
LETNRPGANFHTRRIAESPYQFNPIAWPKFLWQEIKRDFSGHIGSEILSGMGFAGVGTFDAAQFANQAF